MDIYSFVNSKAIRGYLREIKYEFSSMEAAWLIYACRALPYAGKRAAWLELIDTLPDCEVPKRKWSHSWKSLHEMLRQYIRYCDEILDDFLNNESPEYVYRYTYIYGDDERWDEEYKTVYASLRECMDGFHETVEPLDEDYTRGETGVVRYRLRRQSLRDVEEMTELEFRGNGEFECICSRMLGDKTRKTTWGDEIDFPFEDMWFAFPTPFEEGDIVWVAKENQFINWKMDGGFVLTDVLPWKTNEFIIQEGDMSDMAAQGYFANPNGTVYHEDNMPYTYMDLDYYDGPYKPEEGAFPALSKYLKGEICLELLLCLYRKVTFEMAADDIMLKGWFDPEAVEKLLGNKR